MTFANQFLLEGPREWSGSISQCWQAFLERYSLESDCLEELCRLSDEVGSFQCSECAQVNTDIVAGARFVVCSNCRNKDWRTAGTIFEGIRRPRAWLGGLWLIHHGVAFNAGDLQRLAGVSRDCAANIIKKLSMLMQRSLDLEQSSGAMSLDDLLIVESASLLGIVGKRSRITPANMHPRVEEEILEREVGAAGDGSRQSAGKDQEALFDFRTDVEADPLLGCDERRLYSLLTDDFKSFDALFVEFGDEIGRFNLALMNLQMAGWLEQSFGLVFKRRLRKKLNSDSMSKGLGCADAFHEEPGSEDEKRSVAKAAVETLINSIRNTFHAVSRRFLQIYSAFFVFLTRQKWGANPNLLELCRVSRPISKEELKAFVTPLSFSLPSLSSLRFQRNTHE